MVGIAACLAVLAVVYYTPNFLRVTRETEVLWHNRFPSEVRVLDAETGKLQWSWAPPDWEYAFTRADLGGIIPRIRQGNPQPVCIPNPWGSPSIDAEGFIYLAHMNGLVYVIRDDNDDGVIDDKTEVSSFDAGSSFGHGGAALGPDTLAIAHCQGVMMFKR
eukprot:CAMPEP_0197934396 /NCGR_PEP_ID=MMETSP1439-20131203/111701_1 /TAXON_ID=66791 /ORGANISM="Gonyaulax spinifera, Strain CCMP409" /LENGTH=160 /DNA_ID=CAMNT_0043557285 /DNA_START=14 /DNA_END=496 /DNA_ORIENTATION=-